MDDQLDNDLKNRIREVFDNYEDTTADEGWLLLREKYPEKAKRRPVAWLWFGSAAALLLLFIGILWLNNKPVNKPQLAIGKKHPVNNSVPKTVEHPKDNILSDSSALHQQNQQLVADNIPHVHAAVKSSSANPGNQQVTAAPSITVNKTNPAFSKQNGFGADSSKAIIAAIQSKTPNQNTANTISTTPVTSNKVQLDTGNKTAVKSMAVVTTPRINMQQANKPKKPLFADDNNTSNQSFKSQEKIEKKDDHAVRFGIYAATYFNYAKGSNNQLNVGAGVTSDIKLTKNLKLSTGVTIAQNTLNYSNQLPVAAASSKSLAANPLYSANDAFIAATSVPSLKNYSANLVGLDVPINLKYEFNPQKSDAYISAGLSSGTFINEKYTSSYNYSSPFASNVTQTQDQSVNQSFNSFYFAKTLNISFGMGYPLGRNKLIIEPFLKYPLSGLGSQDIRFGAGGVNLKFNIQGAKK